MQVNIFFSLGIAKCLLFPITKSYEFVGFVGYFWAFLYQQWETLILLSSYHSLFYFLQLQEGGLKINLPWPQKGMLARMFVALADMKSKLKI